VHFKVETTFSLAEADVVHVYRQDCCPTCVDAALVPLAGGPIHYQYALIEKPIFQQARHAQSYWCANCDTMSTMTLSTGLRPTGLVVPRLTRFIGFLKACERLL